MSDIRSAVRSRDHRADLIFASKPAKRPSGRELGDYHRTALVDLAVL